MRESDAPKKEDGLSRHATLWARRRYSDESLLGHLDCKKLLAGSHHVLVLDSHNTTAPNLGELGVVVVLGLEGLAELLEIYEVLAADFGEGNAGGRLQVDKLAKVGLAADEAEGDTLLSAESGQMDDELNGVDVVGDDDELGLVLFNEGGDVVETKLEVHGLLSLLGLALSLSLEAQSLLLVGLGRVLGKQFKELGSCTE